MSDNRENYLKSIRGSYLSEYVRMIDFNSKHVDISTLKEWSILHRLNVNLLRLKYGIIMSKTNTIVSCFKVFNPNGDCIYAYLYSVISSDPKPKIKHQYVCHGPAFRSQDGEYRSQLISYKQFILAYTIHEDLTQYAEQVILDKMENGEIGFNVDFYIPNNSNINPRKIRKSIDQLRLTIKLFTVCWLKDLFAITCKTIENHINPFYYSLLNTPDDLSLFKNIYKTYNYELYNQIMNNFNVLNEDVVAAVLRTKSLPQCGQKILSLTTVETIRTDDIYFDTWREIYIQNMASNLVLNIISPSFSFISSWFYIHNTKPDIFDNPAMHSKYINSQLVQKIVKKLKHVDELNYIDQTPINSDFKKLSHRIHKSILFAESDINLTDMSICVLSENVGRTIRDIPSIISNNPDHIYSKIFSSYECFNKHVFEYIYSFYCMNSKTGIIHSDLHLNNVTIFIESMLQFKERIFVQNPHIVYVINKTVYMLPHTGCFSCIIDFSRAILGDYAKIQHEFSPKLADIYFKNQHIHIIKILRHYLPDLMKKYENKIDILISANFPLFFKILTAIDTYTLMSNLKAMLTIDKVFVSYKLDPMFELLDRLIAESEQLMIKHFMDAIDGVITNPSEIEWPNLEMIINNFSNHILKEDTVFNESIKPNILDIFNSNNSVKYEIDDYDTLGPLVSLDIILDAAKKENYPLHEGIINWLEFKNTNETQDLDNLIAKYKEKEKDILQYEEWMTM